MISKCLFIFCSVLSVALYAQKNFEPAIIVTTGKDTVSGGFIDNRYWSKNPDKISYRSASGQEKTYGATDIEAFYLVKAKEWYRGRIVTLDNNSNSVADITNEKNQFGNQVDSVFLRMIVEGRISLYYVKGILDKVHFLAEKDGKMQELRVEQKMVDAAGTQKLAEVNHYKSQLDVLMNDAPVRINVEDTRLYEKPILKLIVRYNSQFEDANLYVQPSKAAVLSLSVLFGGNSSHLDIIGQAYQEPKSGYARVYSPFAGVGLEVILPRSRTSWSFNNDFVYRYYSIEDKFEAKQIKLFTSVRYRFPTGKVRPFLGAGLTSAYAISGKSTPERTTADFRKYEQGLLIECGVTHKRMFVVIRHEKSNGFSPYLGTSTKFSSLYAGVGFRITSDN